MTASIKAICAHPATFSLDENVSMFLSDSAEQATYLFNTFDTYMIVLQTQQNGYNSCKHEAHSCLKLGGAAVCLCGTHTVGRLIV